MSLVDYSSSDDDTDGTKFPSNERRNTLPNPFKAEASILDENSTVGFNGRTRTFAHERGIWASYVYIQYPRNEAVETFQNAAKQAIESALDDIEILHIDDLHMSLSRTVVLRHHWIDGFAQSIKQCLSDIKAFSIFLSNINIVCNDERTRTFICLAIDPNVHSSPVTLRQLTQQVDRCLDAFKLPPFYENAMYHVSVLWCLGNRKTELENIIEQLQAILDEGLANDNADFRMDVTKLQCKIGNRIFEYVL